MAKTTAGWERKMVRIIVRNSSDRIKTSQLMVTFIDSLLQTQREDVVKEVLAHWRQAIYYSENKDDKTLDKGVMEANFQMSKQALAELSDGKEV